MHRLIAGRYELLKEIGTGGAAKVYLAKDSTDGATCAVKVLHEKVASEHARRRMRTEHAAMATLEHPRILRVRDGGVDEAGHEYFVMDYAPNGTLADQLEVRGALPVVEVCARVCEVLDALASAHDHGIVHRDVKPQNILICDEGRSLLADFGIALVETNTRATQAGARLGSVAFMPPEQRADARSVRPAADLYSVGATMFHLLTGANPIDLFMAEASSPRFYGVAEPLISVIARATRKRPGDRYPSAAAMREALEQAVVDASRSDVTIANYLVTGSVRLPTKGVDLDALHAGDSGSTKAESWGFGGTLLRVAVAASVAGAGGAAVAWYLFLA